MAEAIFAYLVEKERLESIFSYDSAGTSAYHIGQHPDARALAQLKDKGITTAHRARQFTKEDATDFSHIFAMDKSNYEDIKSMAGFEPDGLALLRTYDPQGRNEDVPDPYYGGRRGFEEVYDMLLRSLKNFIQQERS